MPKKKDAAPVDPVEVLDLLNKVEDLPVNEQSRAAIERTLSKATAALEGLVENGGVKKVGHLCTQCGKKDWIEVGGADAELYVKMVSALSSAVPKMKSVDGPSGVKAQKLLQDFSEMTSADLATYISDLEAEIAQLY